MVEMPHLHPKILAKGSCRRVVIQALILVVSIRDTKGWSIAESELLR